LRLGRNDIAAAPRVCPLRVHPLARIGWILTGFTLLTLGTIGILVPGWPTTIFVLLASACFIRSEPRLAAWLDRHPVFGRFLRLARGGRPTPVKVGTLLVMWASAGLSIGWMLTREAPMVLAALATVIALACASVVIVRLPGRGSGCGSAGRAPPV